MKKSMLYTGICYFTAGVIFIVLAAVFEFKIEGLLWGLGGSGTGGGLAMIYKYFYWTRPEKKKEYEQRLYIESIEMHDERKIMLRDKSGRITYLIMMGLYCVLIMLFTVLSVFDLFMPFAKYMVIGLCILMVFQYVCGMVIFSYLNNRM